MSRKATLEDELRRFFFLQSMAKSALSFASMENTLGHMIVRVQVGKIDGTTPYFMSHLQHTNQLDIKHHEGNLIVDLRLTSSVINLAVNSNLPWDKPLFFCDAYSNKHYLSNIVEIYYMPDDVNQVKSHIKLTPWGLDFQTDKGTKTIEEALK